MLSLTVTQKRIVAWLAVETRTYHASTAVKIYPGVLCAHCSFMRIHCPFNLPPVPALRDFSVSHNKLDSFPPCESVGLVVDLYRMASCMCSTCSTSDDTVTMDYF